MSITSVLALIAQLEQELGPVFQQILADLQAGSISQDVAHAKMMAAANEHLGKLGDGHLIQIFIQYGPAIIAAIIKGLTGGGVLPPIPTPKPAGA
ncbi:MAG: hypothetical protein KGL35_14465 [Bradyrhizobium sp.]|nr:hypothetical protein [Bradyrhizobium sp.]